MWKACITHGVFVLSMDDMYSVLCHAFVCPNWIALAADLGGGQQRGRGEAQYLQVSAGAWSIAGAILR